MTEIGCDMAQGFLFGRPVPPESIDIHCRSIQAASA
jgi:EAL domain-containing protein (putative c-di-GMP-specific phosphodiesterase class I)